MVQPQWLSYYPNETAIQDWHSARICQLRHTAAKTVKYSHAGCLLLRTTHDAATNQGWTRPGAPMLVTWVLGVACTAPALTHTHKEVRRYHEIH